MERHSLIISAVATLTLCFAAANHSHANPTLKGPLPGVLDIDPATGFATFEGSGRLTLMGKVTVYAEFVFVEGETPDSLEGAGIAEITAANGDVLVSNVVWNIDADGSGALEFRWPGEITFSDGTTANSTGRFVELPFAGLRGVSNVSVFGPGANGVRIDVRMTGEIIDPDPI